MPIERIIVVGAGGHARVVMDSVLLLHEGMECCFVDDDASLHGRELLGCRVLGPLALVGRGDHFHVAIGDNRARSAVAARLEAAGARALQVVHPQARVSRFAVVAPGAFVAAGAVVAPLSHVEAGAIVNHGAVVDHDCRVGEFSHIAPNATLAGGVSVGRGVLVGAGANLLPGVVVGDEAVIGAGAVVLADVEAGSVIAGVPAKGLRKT